LQPCVELLEMKTREFVGLLPLLSEETRLPKGRRRPSAMQAPAQRRTVAALVLCGIA
jgi:myosin heavy subunit